MSANRPQPNDKFSFHRDWQNAFYMALYRKLEKDTEFSYNWPCRTDVDFHMIEAGFTPMDSVVFAHEEGIYFKKFYYRGQKKSRVYILTYDCNGWSLRVNLEVKK